MQNFLNNKNYLSDKKKIERKLELIKNVRSDPNNVILNSAAIQDQMLIDMGIKKKKLKKLNLKPEDDRTKPMTKILDKIINKNLEKEKEGEVLIRQKNYLNNLTLAQKIGLKQINKLPLSLDEWRNLEIQTVKREDHKSNCPICLESLFKKETIILSCSHIFHKICIKNFEKFTNNKKCPICRCQNYESKGYYKDKEHFIKQNIILIQKNYRGYSLRLKLYNNIFKNQMPKNKHLRLIYSHWRIKELTYNMCKLMEEQVKESQTVISNLVKEVKEISIKNKQSRNELIKFNKLDEGQSIENFSDWNKILNEMKKRKTENCAICLGSLNNKNNYLLNCTHCFHKNCLDSFERYDSYYERRCPICRKNYEKKEIFNDFL
jgi:hypothetical protein